jgi:DHA2 family multidrug resistance protein
MFLDRGEQLDWFDSPEIRIEAAGALVAFAFFVAHTWTVQGQSFFNRELLKDRNFVAASAVAFVVGMILFATMALLPTFLQTLMGYPVVTTGLVTAPRGIGTMLTMLTVGRLLQRGWDTRLIMAIGFVCTAFSLYQMTQMTLQMDSSLIIISGFIQGVGIGLTFVPLSAAAFATLAPQLRDQGTPIFSLLRNIGSSVGISVVQMLLVRGTVSAHSHLAESMHVGSPGLLQLPPQIDISTSMGQAVVESELLRQASMIAYIDSFWVMMALTLLTIPLLLLISKLRRGATMPSASSADMVH